MRTVSVNVMWDVQEKNYFSAWEHLWDAKDRTRGFLWGGDPLFRQVREGTGAEAPRRPLRRFPGTFTRHPPVLCSQSIGFRHGDSRNTSESILGGRPGHRRSGSHELARGATRDASRVHP